MGAMKQQEYSRTWELTGVTCKIANAVCWLSVIVGVIFIVLVITIADILFFLLSYGLQAEQ